MASDDTLIDETLAGNPAAFGELVRKYQNRLYQSVYHAQSAHADAEDIVQDAFVQAFVKLASFQRQSGFYTWLYRIAFNIAVSHRRRRKAMVSLEQQRETTHCEPCSTAADPHQELHVAEEVRMLRAALLELDDERRQIIVLREIDELSYEQIAAITDLPIGTVRSRLHRARQQLVEIMKRRDPESFARNC